MTTDERIQAIAEKLDTLAKLHIDVEQQMAQSDARLGQRIDQLGQRIDQLARVIDMEHESIKALERIARYHEQRLDDLEEHP